MRSHRVVVVGLAAAAASLLGQHAMADPVIGDEDFPIQGGFCFDVPTPNPTPTPDTMHIGFGFGEQPCPVRGPGVAAPRPR